MRACAVLQDGDYSWDSGERDEQRLAELGRAAVHMYIMSHIFLEKLEVPAPALFLPLLHPPPSPPSMR